MFGVRLDWPLRPFGAGAGGLTPEEARRGVHFTHDMTFHRPAHAGDRLTTSGRVVVVEPHTPGAYLLTRYDTVDADGAPVLMLTTWYGSLFRGVAVRGEARAPERSSPLPEVSLAHASFASIRLAPTPMGLGGEVTPRCR